MNAYIQVVIHFLLIFMPWENKFTKKYNTPKAFEGEMLLSICIL